jgi:hypothetical protein
MSIIRRLVSTSLSRRQKKKVKRITQQEKQGYTES